MSDEGLELVKTFLPIGLTLVTIIGGIVVYWFQRSLDRKNQILQERRELYRAFINRAQLLQLHRLTNKKDEAWDVFEEFKLLLAELLVTAPDTVVEPLKGLNSDMTAALSKSFTASRDDDPYDDVTSLSALVSKMEASFDIVVAEMRKDTFNDTELSAAFLNGIVRASMGFRI